MICDQSGGLADTIISRGSVARHVGHVGQKWELGRIKVVKLHILPTFLSLSSVFCNFWLVFVIFICFSLIFSY